MHVRTLGKLREAAFEAARPQEAGVFGLGAEDYEDDAIVIWPENHRAWLFYTDLCGTQWRWASVGMGAPARTGLDYTAVLACVKEQTDLTDEERKQLFDDVRIMERAALHAASGKPFEDPFDQPLEDA